MPTTEKIETGKKWVEVTLKSMAESFNLDISGLSWQSARESGGVVHTCSVQGRTKRAAKLFTELELESCPMDTHLQQTLVARLAGLMRYLAS
jgi:hypothetical protein